MEIKILNQGAITVNRNGNVHRMSDNVCAIVLDLKAKYAEIFSVGSDDCSNPTIAFSVNEDTLYFDESLKNEITEISLPDFTNWNVWSINVSKYAVYVCLVK